MNEELDARELIFALHKRDGIPGIGKLPGMWHRRLSTQWEMWINGQLTPLMAEPKEGCGMEVQPGDCYVEYNGWPAGSFSLITGEGIIAAGSKGNYHSFCAALKEAIDAPVGIAK